MIYLCDENEILKIKTTHIHTNIQCTHTHTYVKQFCKHINSYSETCMFGTSHCREVEGN